MDDLLARREPRREEPDVLVHGDRAVAPVARGDPAEPALHLRGRERALLVAGREPLPLGQDPDLEKVHGLGARRVVLAVGDAGAGGHALHFAGADDGAGPQAVLVLERALDDVRDDLHVAVAVGGEAAARLYPILVHDAQAAEAHVARVEVVGEGEGVAAREPAELGAAALGARADGDHGASIPAAPGDATLPWRPRVAIEGAVGSPSRHRASARRHGGNAW